METKKKELSKYLLILFLFVNFNIFSQNNDSLINKFNGTLNIISEYDSITNNLFLEFSITVEPREYDYFLVIYPAKKKISYFSDSIIIEFDNNEINYRYRKCDEKKWLYNLNSFYVLNYSFDNSIVQPGIILLKIDKKSNFKIIFKEKNRINLKQDYDIFARIDFIKYFDYKNSKIDDLYNFEKEALLKKTDFIVKHYILKKNGKIVNGYKEKEYEDKRNW